VESELKNFIQLRNDAAHGALSELVGSEALLRQCDLVSALIEALSAYLHRHVVLWRYDTGKVRFVGHVTEVFDVRRAFIVPLQPGASLAVRQNVHLVGQWSCAEASIESVRIDDQDADGVGAFGQEIEIGIVASALPKRNVAVYVDA
jgi:hypothetical protein